VQAAVALQLRARVVERGERLPFRRARLARLEREQALPATSATVPVTCAPTSTRYGVTMRPLATTDCTTSRRTTLAASIRGPAICWYAT